MHQGAQERRDTHVLKRRRYLLVVIGERFGRVGVSSHSCPLGAEAASSAQQTAAETFDAPRTRDDELGPRPETRSRGRSGHAPKYMVYVGNVEEGSYGRFEVRRSSGDCHRGWAGNRL